MPYKAKPSQGYKPFVPKGLKGSAKKLYLATAIRPVGEWSRDLLENTETGKLLAVQHFQNVMKVLAKEKPKTKTQMEKTLKKAVMTPQQRLVILYEKSLREPLDSREFLEYLELFRECFPNAYKALHGDKSPSQVLAETAKTTVKKIEKRK